MDYLSADARKFIDLIKPSVFCVAFTGAGISTESGIPDYRSPGTGIWENIDQSVVSLEGFKKNPKKYYEYALKYRQIRELAKPNSAHYMLSELEKQGLLKGVITQNIDGLHHAAGSLNVHELHGSLRETICLNCGSLFDMKEVMGRVSLGENPPLCEKCGGVLKPNAVFFGEALPRDPWQEAVRLTKQCDLFVAIGSSLQVSPANTLPEIALSAGARLVIINLMPTPYDTEADLVINRKIGEFFEEIRLFYDF